MFGVTRYKDRAYLELEGDVGIRKRQDVMQPGMEV
jgi:hypothetical protein